MVIAVGDPFATFTYHNAVRGSHSIEVVFFARFTESLADLKLNPSDHSEFVWATNSEAERYLIENRTTDIEELGAARHGFALLRSEPPDFG